VALDKLETSVRLLAAAGAHTEAGAVQFWLYAIDDSVLLDLPMLFFSSLIGLCIGQFLRGNSGI